MYQVNQKTVYGSRGIVIIKSVKVDKTKNAIYVAKSESGMTYLIHGNKSEGLRPLSTNEQIDSVLAVLSQKTIVFPGTWNRRYREYSNALETGELSKVAEVYRDLWALREEKDLSFGERKMLEKSKEFLINEISLVRNLNEIETSNLLFTIAG